MTLDASTSITADGTEVLSIVNTGTGNSFLVEDEASTDTTPFVIDASGNVGIGSATPAVALDVVGAVTATGVATTSYTVAVRLQDIGVGAVGWIRVPQASGPTVWISMISWMP